MKCTQRNGSVFLLSVRWPGDAQRPSLQRRVDSVCTHLHVRKALPSNHQSENAKHGSPKDKYKKRFTQRLLEQSKLEHSGRDLNEHPNIVSGHNYSFSMQFCAFFGQMFSIAHPVQSIID